MSLDEKIKKNKQKTFQVRSERQYCKLDNCWFIENNDTKKKKKVGARGREVAGESPPGHLEFSHVLLVKCLEIFSLKLYFVQYKVKCSLWSQQCFTSSKISLFYRKFSSNNHPVCILWQKSLVFNVRKTFLGHMQTIISTTNEKSV